MKLGISPLLLFYNVHYTYTWSFLNISSVVLNGGVKVRFTTEVLWTNYHYIFIFLSIIAFLSLIIGRYNISTIIKSTIISSIFFYGMITVVLLFIIQEDLYREEVMFDALEENYQKRAEQTFLPPNQMKLVAASSIFDKESIEIWAANYSKSNPFHGDLQFIFYKGKEKKKIDVYENINLKPSEKKKVANFTADEEYDYYEYYFIPE